MYRAVASVLRGAVVVVVVLCDAPAIGVLKCCVVVGGSLESVVVVVCFVCLQAVCVVFASKDVLGKTCEEELVEDILFLVASFCFGSADA